MGQVQLSPGGEHIAAVYLKVDGEPVAKTRVGSDDYDVIEGYSLTLNTLQPIDAGQTVTIEFEKRNGSVFLGGDKYKSNHWTGLYLGPSTPPLPQCIFAGQMFEYPGSCRKV